VSYLVANTNSGQQVETPTNAPSPPNTTSESSDNGTQTSTPQAEPTTASTFPAGQNKVVTRSAVPPPPKNFAKSETTEWFGSMEAT
ncbi:MAG: hypothetical protein AB1299_06995, partial [Thermoproteota archaeon]